jgi:hypothetical protein
LRWEPVPLLELLALSSEQRVEALDAVAGAAFGAGLVGAGVVGHLLTELP